MFFVLSYVLSLNERNHQMNTVLPHERVGNSFTDAHERCCKLGEIPRLLEERKRAVCAGIEPEERKLFRRVPHHRSTQNAQRRSVWLLSKDKGAEHPEQPRPSLRLTSRLASAPRHLDRLVDNFINACEEAHVRVCLVAFDPHHSEVLRE